jgi:hypothetical protein
MPSIGQIIPQYLQPHVATYINDNTIISPITPVNVTSPVRTFQVFASKKGRDNRIVQMDSVNDYIAEYGEPDFASYGQACLMPYAFLSSNNGRVFCMRVMPANATYANLMLAVKVKVDDTNPLAPKLALKFTAQYFPSVSGADNFLPNLLSVKNLTPDVDGYATYPVAIFYAQGRGAYGNGLRVRISSSPDADKDNTFKNHRVEIFTSDAGLVRVGMHQSSLYPGAVVGTTKTAYFMEDVINDVDTGSTKVSCFVATDTLQEIYDIYKTDVDPATTYTVQDFDFLTGFNKYTYDIEPKIVIDRVSTGAVSIDRIEGLVFTGGDDGDFASTADPIVKANSMDACYIAALSGTYDRRILSKTRTPSELVFDANYRDAVKKKLMTLLINRYDALGYIDAGILNTPTDAINWAESMVDFSDRIFTKQCQHYKLRDPFTGKINAVTVNYFLASRLPSHYKLVGNQVPFVGQERAQLTGYIRNTLLPIIDADDLEIKEQLFTRRVNYFQAVAEDVYIRSTQTTAQFASDPTTWSDLSEENNMAVLLEMKRILETYTSSKLYNFVDPTARRVFTDQMKIVFGPYAGTKVESFEISFEMNQWETERSIIHCYLGVVFRQTAKRGIIEIDINRRS